MFFFIFAAWQIGVSLTTELLLICTEVFPSHSVLGCYVTAQQLQSLGSLAQGEQWAKSTGDTGRTHSDSVLKFSKMTTTKRQQNKRTPPMNIFPSLSHFDKKNSTLKPASSSHFKPPLEQAFSQVCTFLPPNNDLESSELLTLPLAH